MSLLVLLAVVAGLGIAAYFVPMIPFIDDFFKRMLRFILIGAAIIIVLAALGVFDFLSAQSVRVFGRG